MQEPKTAELAWWIQERYAILERRRAGMLPPWTADPVMATVRFCNVHREDDKVTQWIRMYYNRAEDPAWKFVMGRLINNIGSLNHIRLAPTPAEAISLLADWRECGNKVFSSAYIVSTCGAKMDKLDYVQRVCEAVIAEAIKSDGAHEEEGCTLASMHEWLMHVDGLGSFLAAQVVADMKNTAGHPLQDAPDWWTWCAWGPGSIKGLAAFFSRQVTPATFHKEFRLCRSLVDPLIPSYIPRISAQDFQNCLCEYSKYARVKAGGHARNRYHANH